MQGAHYEEACRIGGPSGRHCRARRSRLQPYATMSTLSFFLAWLANPRRVGAIVPSSAALADAITADLTPASAPVIELGPATAVVTRSIIARGIPEHRLALIEYGANFVDKLQRDF